MTGPLISRPSYGQGTPATPTATSQLPDGGPADKGLPLKETTPGTQTFSKPLDDHGTTAPGEEKSIYHRPTPRELGKRPDGGDDSISYRDMNPSFMGLGDKDPADFSKTPYPYRDGKPNAHNASDFVAQLYILERKASLVLSALDRTTLRVAATAEQILAGLNPKFVERSKTALVTLKRADLKNLRWIFSVKGNGTYAVKLRAIRPKKNRTKLSKMDLELSCSCPAWQWLGPEFHAKKEDYQLGALQGTASPPDIRDPDRINRVCKHVAAVLEATRNWDIPVRK